MKSSIVILNLSWEDKGMIAKIKYNLTKFNYKITEEYIEGEILIIVYEK
jgi:hypothetical protein